MTSQLSSLYERDITRVIQELQAFPDDATLWKTLPGVSNPAGNLVLHLEGNLREYIGRLLGGVEYQRDRPLEFSDKGRTRDELVARMTPVKELVPRVIASLSPTDLEKPFPDAGAAGASTGRYLVHLYGHLSYHLGQIDYLRRVLTAGKAVDFAR